MNIRNFCIIAHIDHGKSTLADRFLELTGTVEKRKMHEQFLDMHPLERERGITIKMQPVRMLWHPDRKLTQNNTQNNAEEFLYKELSYRIRGLLFDIRKKIGLGHKEQVYHSALEIELKKAGIRFESKKNISIMYEGKNIGTYQPDFLIEDKVLVELKALPEISRPQIEQIWTYLKGCHYKLAFLVNFGSKDLEIKRVVYDLARLRDSALSLRVSAGVPDQVEYILNLIDTPGHVDFTYEVSRALAAVEGAILLVDATQGVQAQTIANLHLAEAAGLKIIPAINKIDLTSAEVERMEEEIKNLLDDPKVFISRISAKSGTGVEELLERVIEEVPEPGRDTSTPIPETSGFSTGQAYQNIKISEKPLRALVFDSIYDPYQGVIAYMRIFEGNIESGEGLYFMKTDSRGEAKEVGIFSPQRKITGRLGEGEIGYVVTGIKEPDKVRVGDTVTTATSSLRDSAIQALPGYKEPEPMVFASVFPENQDDYTELRESLKKLKLNDAAVIFEAEESVLASGRGFRMGFLGLLHMEITAERLRREYNLKLVFSNPSVSFNICRGADCRIIYSPAKIPTSNLIEKIEEPWVRLEIILPAKYLGGLTTLLSEHAGRLKETRNLVGERLLLLAEAPLREIIVDFYDQLKSISQGFASMAYELLGYREGDLVRMDILVAGEKVPSFTEVVPKEKAYSLGRAKVEKLKNLLPRELFAIALQAETGGKIIARETIPALRKDVTGYLYGGDRTRKMKLWKKQQKGKKRLLSSAKVDIPAEVFLKMIRR